ncbi:hypothetical protein F4808DRAFT_456050 [Astrocystis sublimbata]|nr:hypothetical protein F4808DRAFT_456047 [Astrocystis sublimbata]KAI0205052.1 hypothetical protein F4808DRAFT_456050 [Astrocystis sublimbata]
MPKLVTVVGATGNQGSAVIEALISDPAYTLRGLTRNTSSPAAQALSHRGVEIVSASLDDLPSLKAAFAGSYAVYGVTGLYELLAKHSPSKAAEIEEQWGKNIAQAAAETQGLEHFIWSTLPPAAEISAGKYVLTNHVSKNGVDEYIRSGASSELAEKTTYLFIGQYHSNYSYGPVSIHKIPSASNGGSSDTYVHLASHASETPIYWIGDVTRNLRPFVKAIFDDPEKTKGNVVFAYSEVTSSEESLQIWARAKGVRAFHVPVSTELLHDMWGEMADFLGGMWRYWGEYGEKAWSKPGYKVLTGKDLDVHGDEFVSLEESFKDYEI